MTEGSGSLHDAPLEAFTSFFIFPFCFNESRHSKHSNTGNLTPGPQRWRSPDFEAPQSTGDLSKGFFPIQRNYAEFIYFHDYVRSFLFTLPAQTNEQKDTKKKNNRDKQKLRFYEYDLGKTCFAILETVSSKKMYASVAGIYMHVYPGEIAFLVIEIEKPPSGIPGGLLPEDAVPLSSGSDLLLFNQMFRRIYPAYFEEDNFFEQVNNQEFPKSISMMRDGTVLSELKSDHMRETHLKKAFNGKCYPHFSCHISPLIDSFISEKIQTDQCEGQNYFPILDDRMLVLTYAAFPNFIPTEERAYSLNVYFSQLLYVDCPANDFRYEKSFFKKLIEEHSYGRWSHWDTRIGFSRYSGAFLFFGHAPFLYRPVVSMYYQMFLLIIYYRARLVRFSDEVSAIARDWPSEKDKWPLTHKDRLRALHTQFMRFMNIDWFREVTNQDQGIEVFELMRKSFDIDSMYNQVKDEIERADDLAELLHNQKVERFNRRAGWIGIFIGLSAILTGFFGMNFKMIGGQNGWGEIHWLFLIVLGATVLFSPLLVILGLKIYENLTRIKVRKQGTRS